VRGAFEKKAIVWSNDQERRSVALYLKGEVKPHVSLEPGGYLSLWGVKGQVPREHLDVINNHKRPLKIMRIDNDLPDRVRWTLEEIRPGFVYRLTVEDISNGAGDYKGYLIISTDNPLKPELKVIVTGQISE
jgi:hypothetical protein